MKKIFFILTVISLPLFFMACDSEDDKVDFNNPNGNRLPTAFVQEDGFVEIQLFYDNQNRIEKIEEYHRDELTLLGFLPPITRYSFEYNAQGKISKLTEAGVYTSGTESNYNVLTFAYVDANTIRAVDGYGTNMTLNLDANGRLANDVVFQQDGDTYTFTHSYDSRGNCTSISLRENLLNLYSENFTAYDDKKGIFSGINEFPSWLAMFWRNSTDTWVETGAMSWIFSCVNNPTKWDLWSSYYGDVQYEYDSYGYPIKMTETTRGGTSDDPYGGGTEEIVYTIKYIDAK